MKILIGAQFYPPIAGGEEFHVRNLAHHLTARGHDVEVLTLAAGPGDAGTEDDRGVRVIRVTSSTQRIPGLYADIERPHAPPVSDPAIARAAGTLLQTGRHDVIHAHNWIVNSLLGVSRRTGTPLILTLHDYSHVCAVKRLMRNGSECSGPSLGRCASCAATHYGFAAGVPIALATLRGTRMRQSGVSRFIAVSVAVAGRNRLADSPVPFEVIPNFIADELLDPMPQVEGGGGEDGPIVFVGDLSRDKGVPVLLQAYKDMTDPPPLVLAGRRAGSPLDLPIGAQVLSELPHAEVIALMRSSRCVVVPSVWPDPCPTVVLEAMAVGRPVVASSVGGIVDMVQDGVTGRLVAPGDAAALTRALTDVLARGDRGRSLGVAGRIAVERFTAGSVVPRIESAYVKVSGHRNFAQHAHVALERAHTVGSS